MKAVLSGRAAVALAGFTLLSLLASFCFKESGTDPERSWLYFWVGNVFGPLSLIFLMWLYGLMNASLASALAMGLGSCTVQIAFWLAYRTSLEPSQWLGIALVTVGGIIAVSGGGAEAPAGESGR